MRIRLHGMDLKELIVRKEITMDRETLIDALQSYFNLETDDLDSYDWQAGAYTSNGEFLSLANVVNALEDYLD